MQTWWNYMDTNFIGSANWAVETNTETSSVFTITANANGPWTKSSTRRQSSFRQRVARAHYALRASAHRYASATRTHDGCFRGTSCGRG